MNEQRRARLIAYGVAVVAPAVTLLVGWPLDVVLEGRVLYMAFFPAVLLASYFGGFWPGLLATVLSALAATFFLVEPLFSLQITRVYDALAVTLFVLVGTVISGLSESRLRAHRRIKARERRYAVTLASIGDAVIATDNRARVTFVNPAAEALTGWPLADAVGQPLAEVFRIVNEQTRRPVEDPAAKVLRTGTVVGLANHTALLARDGRETPIDDCGAPILDDRGATVGVVLVFRDVTQRRRAEEAEAIRRVNQRLKLALRGSNVGVWDIEMQDGDYRHGQRHYVNVWEQLGYEGRPAGETALDMLHSDDRVRVEEAACRYLAGETTEYETESRLLHKDGSYRTMLGRGVAVRDAGGKPTRFVGVTIDITQLKFAEEELRRTTALLQAVADGTQDAVYLKDRQGRHLMFNAAASRLVGKPIGEVLGRDDTAIFDPDSAREVMAHDRQVMESGVATTKEHELSAGGVTRTYLSSKAPHRDGHGNVIGLIGISHDITERKRAEEALRQANDRVELAVRTSNIGIWECDMPDGRIENAHLTLVNMWESLGYDSRTMPTDFASACAVFFHPDDLERVGREMQELLASDGQEWKNEYRALTKDGRARWLLARGTVFRDSDGKPVRFIGTSTDITDRKRAEEALRESEERFSRLARATNDAVWDWDLSTNKVWWNEGVYTLFGYRLEQDASDPAWWLERIHPEDHNAVEKFFFEVVRGKDLTWVDEYRFRCADGSYKDVYDRGYVIRDVHGTATRMIGAMLDITGRKRAEEALRESEQRWRSLAEALPQLVWTDTPDGYCDYLSTQWEKYTGVPAAEHIGWRWMEALHPDDRERARHRWTEAVAGRADYDVEFRIRRADGEYRWFKARGVPVRDSAGEIVKWFGTCTDITDLRQTQEALRQANARLDLAVRGSNMAIWECDMPDGRIENSRLTLINVWELMGYDARTPPTDFRSTFAIWIHPDDQERLGREIQELLASDGRKYENEYRARTKDGSTRWHLARGTVLREPQGKPVRFIGTSTDITDRKRAEEALRESEERFRGTFENAAVGIVHNDSAGRFLRVNEKFCGIVGYSREELLQKTLRDVIHPDDLAAFVERYALCFARGEAPPLGMEKRYRRKDGSTVWVEAFASFQRDESGRPAYAIAAVQDVSERKRLDEELRQAKEAAEAANRAKDDFLANVSHEIRTPMNAIIGMTELVLDTPLEEGQRQGLKTVKSAADSLLGIINDLLDFSKIEAGKLELVPADFSLRGAVGDTLRALAVRAHKKGLELIYEVQTDLPDALIGDAGRLRQVLLNLVGNAVKFTDEGEVVVRVEIQGGGPAPSPGAGEVGLRFTVRDTGIGIPSDQQERIFRAFEQEDTSTTRKYGGTGLGLTIASRLVALMGGTITVESAPRRGSTFAFTARFGRQPHPSGPAPAQPPVSLYNLPVLVVDDNATNRHILAEWLRGWQMNPAAVDDGMAAMDALWHRAANGRPYALVLLDARMPDADGLTVAAMIRERAELAATRIILLTSGERPGDLARVRELRIDAQLLKPVQQDELLETIYRVMSRSQGNAPPLARPTPTQQAPSPVPTTTPLHILVAEDNELSAQVLEQSLVRQGHRVRLASNGREVLTLAEQGGFDLLLLDVHMPELDGFQVVRAVRERELTTGGHLPIIALTARSRKEDRERCLAAGMDDFQTKPIRPADLLAAIGRVLRTHSSRQSRRRDLLDAAVLLAACGGDPTLLGKMCQTLTARVPEHLAALRDALRDQDAPRLREAAHKCCGMLSEFSTVAGDLAGSLEDLAAGGQVDKAAPILEQLEKTARELLEQVDGLSIGTLRHQAEAADEHRRPIGS